MSYSLNLYIYIYIYILNKKNQKNKIKTSILAKIKVGGFHLYKKSSCNFGYNRELNYTLFYQKLERQCSFNVKLHD